MSRTRRDALLLICQLTSAATIGLHGCGTDPDSTSPVDMPQTPNAPDPDALDVLSKRLPLSTLAPLIENYLTDQTIPSEQDPISALGPLGEQWFSQQATLDVAATAESLSNSLGFMTSLPPNDVTPELITDRINLQYDIVDVVEIAGWWMTQIEAAFCSIAYLVLRERMIEPQPAQPS